MQLVQSFPTTLVSMAVQPREMRILPHRNWLDHSGDVVSPAVPGILLPLCIQERRDSTWRAGWCRGTIH
jgi:hypothetical protein